MRKRLSIGLGFLLVLGALGACQGGQQERQTAEGPAAILQVQSDAFQAEGAIPQRYTCDGEDVSPPLTWSEPPVGTQSLALICDDPDAPVGTWDHWVLFNIPATTRALPEGVPADPVVSGVGTQGSNSWRNLGYGGPCPPPGSTHGYYFRLFALDANLDLDAGSSRKELEQAMNGHIRAEGQLMGRYGR